MGKQGLDEFFENGFVAFGLVYDYYNIGCLGGQFYAELVAEVHRFLTVVTLHYKKQTWIIRRTRVLLLVKLVTKDQKLSQKSLPNCAGTRTGTNLALQLAT